MREIWIIYEDSLIEYESHSGFEKQPIHYFNNIHNAVKCLQYYLNKYEGDYGDTYTGKTGYGWKRMSHYSMEVVHIDHNFEETLAEKRTPGWLVNDDEE